MARGVIYPGSAFVGVEFSTNFWFLGHNFDSRDPRTSTKGSKDSDDSLGLRKTLSQKIARWVGVQG